MNFLSGEGAEVLTVYGWNTNVRAPVFYTLQFTFKNSMISPILASDPMTSATAPTPAVQSSQVGSFFQAKGLFFLHWPRSAHTLLASKNTGYMAAAE